MLPLHISQNFQRTFKIFQTLRAKCFASFRVTTHNAIFRTENAVRIKLFYLFLEHVDILLNCSLGEKSTPKVYSIAKNQSNKKKKRRKRKYVFLRNFINFLTNYKVSGSNLITKRLCFKI